MKSCNKFDQNYLRRHQIQNGYLYISKAKFKATFPVITVIGARFGIYIIGKFGKITAKAVQFSSSFSASMKFTRTVTRILMFLCYSNSL